MVEIEKATHNILNKDNSLTSPVSYAVKQTRDWDIWLEKNKNYLREKLKEFESPKYLIIIGRGNELTEDQKNYLRSYNRGWSNIELLTYDDVLEKFNNLINNFELSFKKIGDS